MNWKYFTDDELYCPCCDENKMKPSFMARLVEMRKGLDFPFPVTSGYRCKAHNAAVGGVKNSYHTQGRAVDIAVSHDQAYTIVANAKKYGFYGVGVSQKGDKRFIHLDDRYSDGRTVTLFSY